MSTERWTDHQIAELITERVPNVDEASTWVAVVLAESGGNPVAYNLVDEDPSAKPYLSTDNGMFQINSYWNGGRLPVHEANRPGLAWHYSWKLATNDGTHTSNWAPWTAYRSGAYLGETVISFGGGEVLQTYLLDRGYDAIVPLEEGTDVIRYPYGYGTGTMTMDQLRGRYEPRMHPEFARRLFAWLEAQGGSIGIGGGWRKTQPDRPGFAPDGRSFHQDQEWASGITAYAAVDLVVKRPGLKHRAPTWNESAGSEEYGVHTFIMSPEEPWHMQPIETRGWSTWVAAGRPDPDPNFVLPGDKPPPPKEAPMFRFRHIDYADQFAVGTSAIHMTPDAVALPYYAQLPLVESSDRDFLIHCCTSSGFNFADLTPV